MFKAVRALRPVFALVVLVLLARCAPTPERPPVAVVPPTAPTKCEECHNDGRWDPDGDGPAAAAPNVMGSERWGFNVNGHGNYDISCSDCHLLGEHHLDGTLNTLDIPGRKSTRNGNTSHLVEGYFGGGGAGAMQKAFDDYCFSTCHPRGIDMRHSERIDPDGDGPKTPVWDNEVRFGDKTSNPDPKKLRPDEEVWGDGPAMAPWDDAERFSLEDSKGYYWIPWTISDHTTKAKSPPYYGTCTACHDPHGSPATDTSRGLNHMVRYNWKSPPRLDSVFFCNTQCHRH